MKHIFLLSLLALALHSCSGTESPKGGNETAGTTGSGAQANEMARHDKLVLAYIDLKNELASDKPQEAQAKAKTLLDELKTADASRVKDTTGWNATLTKMTSATQTISTTADLQAQRDAFEPLSMAMMDALVKNGLKHGKLYDQHCPMAFEKKGRGANWINEKEEIFNPYRGGEMPNCGAVEREIE